MVLMYQEDAELLFPARVIPTLSELRGADFRELVQQVSASPDEQSLDVLGFSLMMIRLASCLTCTADSYRAMTGCTQCAQKTVRSFRGSDDDLMEAYRKACQDVQNWQALQATPTK